MSHNVFVEGVIFDDIDTLEKAFNELKSEGKLSESDVFHREPFMMRGYDVPLTKVDCGIALPGQSYDVGFQKTDKGLVPYFESGYSPAGLAAEHGTEDINGNTCRTYAGAGQLGQLAQRYRILQLERNARINGMTTRRQVKEKGQMALEVIHTR